MPFLLSSAHDWSAWHSLASWGSMEGWPFIGQGQVEEQVMNGRIDGAPPLSCCWVLSVEILKMSLDSMQRSIVQLLLEACQHGLVLADVVDHRHNHSKGVLPWLQCYICPGKLEEDEDLLFVPDDAGLTDRKNIGGDRGHGEAEGDRPLQLALSHQLRLHFKSHQLDNVLQGLLGAMQ